MYTSYEHKVIKINSNQEVFFKIVIIKTYANDSELFIYLLKSEWFIGICKYEGNLNDV